MSQSENKPKVQKNAKLMLVRYGKMGGLGWFEHHEAHIPKLSSHVVLKTERGLELGEVVGVHNYRGGQFKSTPEQVEQYHCNRTKDFPLGEGGTFVRFATHEDIREQEHLEKSAVGEAKQAQKIAAELNLPMKIIEAEHLFGGERIIFYFTSEGRVDFRELVKRLAREYQTRIELRQIGSRDEARLISDFETCGQQCCCSRYLKILEPVNMRMAKLQKATLDPAKISGHCGRLKCCLRYEDETYMQLKGNLPRKNATVQTPKGSGKAVDMHILTQLVVVQDEMGDRKAWPVDEISFPGKPAVVKKAPMEPDRAEDIIDGAMGELDVSRVDSGIVAELEEMAQAEQGQVSPSKSDSKGQKSEPDNAPKQTGEPRQKDGQEPSKNKNRRGGRNRRRRSKNKNRNPNNPQGGGNQDNKPKPSGGNQNNKPRPSNGNSSQQDGN